MQDYKVNILKKVFGLITLLTLLITSSLVQADPVRIMPLGDSITDGADTFSAEANTSIAYRGPLWTKLSSGGYNVDFVGNVKEGSDYLAIDPSFDLDNEGHDGAYADGIASAVTGYLNDNPADIVLLHIGTNDLFYSETIASTVDDVNTTLENIDSVDNGIKVILARIINHLNGDDQKTTDFNIALNTMVQKRITDGDDIIIVDMENGADINYTTDMIDVLHPNVTGYEKMADLWYSTLSTVLTPIVPIHLWKLDEETASTTYVDFYSGADGNCTDPGCPDPIAGQINGAQIFDGSDKIDVVNTGTFNWAANASFTIEFWMKTGVTSVNGKNNVMMGRKSGSNITGLAWFIGVMPTKVIRFGLNDSDDGGHTIFDGTTPVADDTWHHVVCVRDGTNNENRLYVDGALENRIIHTYSADFNESTAPVNIGYLDWDGGYDYNGTLDEVAVYNSALSPGLIYQHYMNGLNGIGVGDDIIAPVITMIGSDVSIELGTAYIDAGATASDNIDGNITANIVTVNPVDVNSEGNYTVTYDVNDSAGNPAVQVTRTVTVTQDATPPVITLIGSDVSIELGTAYTDEGATATDNIDGDITANIVAVNPVDINTVGVYTVTYDVNDTAGNAAVQVTRTVTVTPDSTLPVTAETNSSGGGCSYNPNSKNFDMTFLLMMALGLLYPFRRRFIK